LAAHLPQSSHSPYHASDEQAFLSKDLLLSFEGYHLKAGPEILSRLALSVLDLTEVNILETAALPSLPRKPAPAHVCTFLETAWH